MKITVETNIQIINHLINRSYWQRIYGENILDSNKILNKLVADLIEENSHNIEE
jgi:hypothetical protein